MLDPNPANPLPIKVTEEDFKKAEYGFKCYGTLSKYVGGETTVKVVQVDFGDRVPLTKNRYIKLQQDTKYKQFEKCYIVIGPSKEAIEDLETEEEVWVWKDVSVRIFT